MILFQRLAPSQHNVFKPKLEGLAFGMWNIIAQPVSSDCIHLLMTNIDFSS